MRKGGSRTEETVKDVNGRLLRRNEARKRWAEYFEELLNVQEDTEAGSVIAANGGVEADVRHRVNEGCKVLGSLKGVMKNRGLGMNVN